MWGVEKGQRKGKIEHGLHYKERERERGMLQANRETEAQVKRMKNPK